MKATSGIVIVPLPGKRESRFLCKLEEACWERFTTRFAHRVQRIPAP
jgi:hypothetical protein